MADEPVEEKEGEGEGAEGEKKGGASPSRSLLKWVLIGALGAAAVTGGGLFFMKKGPPAEEQAPQASEEAEAVPASLDEPISFDEEGMTIYDLDPFIVNLDDPDQIRYLKVTVKLHLANEKFVPMVEHGLPQIRDTLLILLSSKTYAHIRSVEGKMELRDEIIKRVNTVLKKRVVRTAYFTEFVAQ